VATLVCVPTYNEAGNIAEVLTRTRRASPDASILVIDDGSPDGTADAASELAEQLGGIEVMRRAAKAGLGRAYMAAFAWGLERGFDVLVEMDADLSHDPAALPDLERTVASGADLAIGSRYVPGGATVGWAVHRRVLSRGGNLYASTILRLPVRDLTSGFRAYAGTALRSVDFAKARADGYGFQIEMALAVARSGGVIREIPITFTERVSGESKMSSRIAAEALVVVTRLALGV